MKNYIDTVTGNTVKAGDIITRKVGSLNLDIELTNYNIKLLLDSGVLKEVIEPTPGFYSYAKKALDKFYGENLNLDVPKVCKAMSNHNKGILLSLVLKEIAIDLDDCYPNHISESENIYVISTLNGTICKANKAKIKSYQYFAAFRSVEDAKIACHLVRHLLKEMFSGK